MDTSNRPLFSWLFRKEYEVWFRTSDFSSLFDMISLISFRLGFDLIWKSFSSNSCFRRISFWPPGDLCSNFFRLFRGSGLKVGGDSNIYYCAGFGASMALDLELNFLMGLPGLQQRKWISSRPCKKVLAQFGHDSI